jgi:hypothetical protein
MTFGESAPTNFVVHLSRRSLALYRLSESPCVPIRSILAGSGPQEQLPDRLTEVFLHKLAGMLNTGLRGRWLARTCSVFTASDAIARKSPHHENPYAIDIFQRSTKYHARCCAVAPCTM